MNTILNPKSIRTSLLGAGDPVKLLDENLDFRKDTDISPNNNNTILLVFLSAIIFISVVAVFEVVRNIINKHQPNSLKSSYIFAFFSIVILIIAIILYNQFIK